VAPLVKKYAPLIAKKLVAAEIDVAVFSPA